ncbi:MAG: hypothetical protein Q9222_004450 [Ikaeria aurantiellina]
MEKDLASTREVDTSASIITVFPGKASEEEDENLFASGDSGETAEVMEDLNFLMFGDTDESNVLKEADVAKIHWSKSAHYNLLENRTPEIDGENVRLKAQWQSLRFSYNMKTGQATYLLACTDDDFEYYMKALGHPKLPIGRRPHPFSIHLILLFKGVLARNDELEEALRRLLYLENRSIFQESKVTFDSGEETKRRLQDLHSLFKDILIRDNNNKRYIATIDSIFRDLERLRSAVRSSPEACPIDENDHQRMVDGFHCLKSFCQDRERRLKSRLQRVQNLIALVDQLQILVRRKSADAESTQTYNLLANRDSITSHSIAQEARQDAAAMKTIAVVTMLFFPATFVSSFLGTKLVALTTRPDGKTRFVFSDRWWIYPAVAIPLTLLTLLTYIYWIHRRSLRAKLKFPKPGDSRA